LVFSSHRHYRDKKLSGVFVRFRAPLHPDMPLKCLPNLPTGEPSGEQLHHHSFDRPSLSLQAYHFGAVADSYQDSTGRPFCYTLNGSIRIYLVGTYPDAVSPVMKPFFTAPIAFT
jgi:hypothetical protein